MVDVLLNVILATWEVLVEAGPYVLFGFFVAGLLKAYVPDTFMARHLGRNTLWSVVKAAVIGVPLPLCSCGVLPTALGLRRQGASKGATTAFMIATPETGVDSMAVTYALIDPIMTVVRPVAASITAIVAGVLVNAFPEREPEPLPMDGLTMSGGLGHMHEHEHEGCGCSGGHCGADGKPTVYGKFLSGMDYAFGEMISDIGRWLLVGALIAGLISAFLPPDLLDGYVGTGFHSYLIMLVVALPLYVCATASTPIAASLLLKGLSPGAALVFLLAGPATNGATITVMLKALGKRAASLYVLSIVLCSLALAYVVDALYAALGLDITAVVSGVNETLPHWVGVGSAVLLLLLVARSFLHSEGGG
ncbi:SO_0444 family Cu/Zn efflux transporter [Pseudodesulfovibrio cashew]|uniref:SO_0444 family Cu/Zn efflux transporter n=1 Tax=Pseudodesulfovibrio cashew TaxID=2678688 RepID=A0A6I6JSU9_9BACT|nr:SO_0444 family Cu/Zn efflux transporter [Pseudodesulfovibrio cashew]QGY40674.1 SO_0444 family Cu/Zn efflux transporter [Pseudodesulfovibrio cashew]